MTRAEIKTWATNNGSSVALEVLKLIEADEKAINAMAQFVEAVKISGDGAFEAVNEIRREIGMEADDEKHA